MFTRGDAEEARLAIRRGLELADRLGDAGYRAILWDGLYAFYMRRGSLREGWEIAYGTPSHSDCDDESGARFCWMRCVSAHFSGSHDEAIAYGEKLLRYPPVSRRVYDTNNLHGRFFQRLSKTLAIEHRRFCAGREQRVVMVVFDGSVRITIVEGGRGPPTNLLGAIRS